MLTENAEHTVQELRSALPGLPEGAIEELGIALKRLVSTMQPQRIYVFGSRVQARARSDSDVDLLMVVSDSELPQHRRSQAAYRAVGLHSLPMDILVLTALEFEERRDVGGSLPATVLREGRLIYAA